jgi:hypothetical protein
MLTAMENLAAMLDGQLGIASRAQLLTAGMSDVTIYRRVRHGAWQRLLPGTFALFSGEPTNRQRHFAAMLYAGAGAQLTGASALRTYGLRYLPRDDRVFVLVPHSVRRKSLNFLQIRRTLDLDEHARLSGDGFLMCSPARALVDTCREITDFRAVRALTAEAIQRRYVSLAALDAEVRRAGRSRTALIRRAAAEVGSGTRSAPEAELREILNASRILPRLAWNAPLRSTDGTRLPTPDGWLEAAAIAVEVDSREYHLSPEDWERTLRRHNELARYGVLVMHFTPSQIRDEPVAVRTAVEDAYRARSAAGITARLEGGAPA